MANVRQLTRFAAACLASVAALPAQAPKPETISAYSCYVQSAESRMAARKTFLLADTDPAQIQTIVRGKIVTVSAAASNPHKIAGGMVYDWVGTIFIPRGTIERTVRMLQDYDHRAEYFAEVIATSKLQCRTGQDRFGFTMRLKEPAVADVDNDVVWERVDDRHWRCRSYSGDVREIGKQHGYLHRLISYWRFAQTDSGVFVEGETITLSGEFGSFMRALGSLAGINPEKSLRKTLTSIRDTVASTREFAKPPSNAPACGEPVKIGGCALQSSR